MRGRPTAIEELQAASAVGQGRLYRAYDELLAEHGVVAAQVLLTFYDVSARTSYLNARQTLGTLLDWGAVPVDQRERHDGDRRDHLRRQRLPRGAGRDPRSALIALIILTNIDGLHSADPARRPGRALVERVEDFALARRARDHADDFRPRLRRHALEGGRRRHGDGRRDRDGDLQRDARRRARARSRRRARGHAVSRRAEQRYSSFKLWLRYAKPSRGTIVVDAGAARALREGGTSLLPVGVVEVARQLRRGATRSMSSRASS